jgi:RimJ/RimL family protein N-acetyltransferase
MFGPYLDCGLDQHDRPVSLHPPKIKDAHILRDWISDPAINRYLCFRKRLSLVDERAWLRRRRAEEDNWLWTIFCGDTMIGDTGLHFDPRLKTGTTGIVIGNRDYWGCGIASLVFARRARFAFEEVGCVTLFTAAFAPNQDSWRASEKLGFTRYGEKPFADLIDGEYVTLYQYYLTRDRWQELNIH